MTTINNLSQFKKALQLGVKVKSTYHLDFAGRGEDGKTIFKDRDLGTRPVSIVQTNSVAFKTTKSDGTTVDSWLQWPKASECEFKGNNTVLVYEDGGTAGRRHVLTYEIID